MDSACDDRRVAGQRLPGRPAGVEEQKYTSPTFPPFSAVSVRTPTFGPRWIDCFGPVQGKWKFPPPPTGRLLPTRKTRMTTLADATYEKAATIVAIMNEKAPRLERGCNSWRC